MDTLPQRTLRDNAAKPGKLRPLLKAFGIAGIATALAAPSVLLAAARVDGAASERATSDRMVRLLTANVAFLAVPHHGSILAEASVLRRGRDADVQGSFEFDIFLCVFLLQYFRRVSFEFLENLFDIKKIGASKRGFVAPEEVKGAGSSEKGKR